MCQLDWLLRHASNTGMHQTTIKFNYVYGLLVFLIAFYLHFIVVYFTISNSAHSLH